jgi:DNA-3-methyladenine glycosylase I
MAGDPLYEAYHDTEWGVPEYDSRALWEKLVLDGFQAGLAWITILRKREHFRAVFDDFDASAIAGYGPKKIASLLADPGIVRHRGKIDGDQRGQITGHARRRRGFLPVLLGLRGGKPIQNQWRAIADVPAQTELAVEVSRR